MIPEEFKAKFKAEIAGKTPEQIIEIIEKYSVVDYNGMQRYVVKKEFEKLVAQSGGLCETCTVKKVKPGIYSELAEKYPLEIRQLRNIIAR